MKLNTRILYISTAVLLLSACTAPKAPSQQGEYDANLKKARAEMKKTDMQEEQDSLSSKGSIVATNIIPVSSRVPGQIVTFSVTLGQHVAKGQVLVRMDDTMCRDKINRAKAEYEQAAFRYQAVLMGLGYKHNNLDSATPEHKSQAAINSGLTVARATYQQAQHELEYYTIKAPLSGVVSNVVSENHSNVAAGQQLFSIIDDKHLEVDFDILESELGQFKIGTEVLVKTTAYGTEEYRARVKEISPEVKSNGTVTIHASIPYSPHLIPGMSAKVLKK